MKEKIERLILLSEKGASSKQEHRDITIDLKSQKDEIMKELEEPDETEEEIDLLSEMTEPEFKVLLALMWTGREIFLSRSWRTVKQEEAQEFLDEYISEAQHPHWKPAEDTIAYVLDKAPLHLYLRNALEYFGDDIEQMVTSQNARSQNGGMKNDGIYC